MSDAALLERRLRQRSALAEFAMCTLGATDCVSVSEAASAAVTEGLGVDHAAVFEQRGDGFELMAAAGWPMSNGDAAVLPTTAAQASRAHTPISFEGSGRSAHGVSTCVCEEPRRLLAAAGPDALALDADDLDFFGDIGAILAGAFECVLKDRTLRESEARAYAVLNTTPDGILTVDEHERIRSFNPAAERLYGYSADEVVGKPLWILVPESYRSYHESIFRTFRDTDRRDLVGIDPGRIGRRSDGSTFPMDVAVSEVEADGPRLFMGVVRDITERRRLEREVVDVVEEERRRFGQVLHDEIGQMLSGVRFLSLTLARRLTAEAPDLASEGAEIASIIHEADLKARAFARGLVADTVDAAGLADSLHDMAERVHGFLKVPVRFQTSGTPFDISDATATHLYRIAQEAVGNAARHGKPSEIKVELEWSPDELCLSVTDDGGGIPSLTLEHALPTALPPGTHVGLGFRTMIYRSRLIGASLRFRPVETGGVSVRCVVPQAYGSAAPPNDGASPL